MTTFDADWDGAELRSAYETDGYVVLRGAFTAEEVEALRAETAAVCTGARGGLIGADPEADAEAAMRATLASAARPAVPGSPS